MMTAHSLNYVVCLRFNERQYFLLWQDGGNQPDKYVVLPNTSYLLMTDSIKSLVERAAKFNLQVADQDAAIVDMDKVFKVLAALRSERPASQRTCQLLLDGWNTLEDMARSINVSPDEYGDKGMLKIIYDKLFYGNNLPAVTPSNRNYQPLFSGAEREAMRRYIRHLWQAVFQPT